MFDEAWEDILEGIANMDNPKSGTETIEQPKQYKDVEDEESIEDEE